MLASVRQYPSAMSFPSSHPSPPKRPRLSLQIKAPAVAQTLGKSSTALKVDIDPTSPTAFNTLSNAYAVAIENSSPRTAQPISPPEQTTATNTKPTSLRLETSYAGKSYINHSHRTQTPGPFSIAYPDTPSTAFPSSTPTTARPDDQVAGASSFFTPPQSAGSMDHSHPRIFTFIANTQASPSSPRTPRRRATIGSQYQAAPYTHPRSLHSILRNSPLPPRSTITPATPSRMSARLADRAAKKVGYNDPLTQTITTNKYIKSHIDLLSEEASPYSPNDPESDKLERLDLTMACNGDETRDGGQTPGPFEEMQRRMAGLGAESDTETPSSRKRKRKEKKRKWVWTIGGNEEGEEAETPATTMKDGAEAAKTPAAAIWHDPSPDPEKDLISASENDSTSDSEMDDRPTTSQSL